MSASPAKRSSSSTPRSPASNDWSPSPTTPFPTPSGRCAVGEVTASCWLTARDADGGTSRRTTSTSTSRMWWAARSRRRTSGPGTARCSPPWRWRSGSTWPGRQPDPPHVGRVLGDDGGRRVPRQHAGRHPTVVRRPEARGSLRRRAPTIAPTLDRLASALVPRDVAHQRIERAVLRLLRS